MATSPSTCVVDANVLVDLHVGGVLHQLAELPFDMVAPDVIVAELERPDRNTVLSAGLMEEALSPDQVLTVAAKVRQYDGVSTNDLFALVLAQAMGTTLLTGDSDLRTVARGEGVDVHGTLWVLDRMVELAIVTPTRAADALEAMLEAGRWLPRGESVERIDRWRVWY